MMKLGRTRTLVLAGTVAVLGSGLGGWAAAGHHGGGAGAGASARLARVAHPIGPGTGITALARDGHAMDLVEGAAVPCGTTLVTDARTRARLELPGGTVVALDRDTRLTYDDPREVQLQSGSVVADLGPAASLVARSPLVEIRSTEARYALTSDDRRASVGVARGQVTLHGPHDDLTVHPGEEAEIASGSTRPEITATGDLGQRIAFGESFDTSRGGDDGDGPPSGIGELRARRPGSKDEIDGAVRLARHSVKARIAGAMARTEIDETFVNTTDRELEGVWRFPLPEGARLERLALEVDGKLVEGEFVDARRASGIWRGVIQQATPTAPRPAEEIIWVPGPWRDPALLEWQRGGRAELKIFPIPRKGTRRVVFAYTQHVELAGGSRRYVYPLAARAGMTPIDEADFDVRVVGGDPAVGVHARGYDLTTATPESSDPSAPASMAMTRSAFTPAGDLVVEYATADRGSEASAVAFSPAGGQDDAFVAIALRPRLPSRIADRSRDQVIVVDTGRAMFGERLRRASRMAVELAQQMDRRDRVTVLACDLECRAMPGGWHAPGAACAHDVDAFLAGGTADGASDLVGAVRAAATVPGRAGDRDLRVVLLSDGVATAGVRGLSRVADEVAEQLSDPRASVVAVPIGSDADVDTLSEITRGGGGTVVPYGAGQALEAVALDVLSATYGATLRDVELTLPDGLHDVAPGAIAPLRAGAETIIAARMKGDHAAGDLVLRGKLAGEPFEARWPIDVRASGDEGNAWTARAWAAGRVADDERVGGDPARIEAIGLSHRFRVPSRLTSLLVLESEAMFHAFGVARAESAFEWTGETEAKGAEVAPSPDAAEKDDVGMGHGMAGAIGSASLGALSGLSSADATATPNKVSRAEPPAPVMTAPLDQAASPMAGAPAGGGGGFAKAPPAATWAPPRPAPPPPFGPDRRRGQWMRRVWFRVAAISADERSPVDASRLEAARLAVAGSPDLRQWHADLAKLLMRAGNVAELEAAAERWSARDPLDPDLLTVRASARAWRGDRDGALRILSGMLASPSTTNAMQAEIASTLARAEERALHPALACELRIAAAESKPDDVATVASAVACERGRGNEASAARWITAAKDEPMRVRLASAASKLLVAPKVEDSLFGDVAVDATWDDGSGADLDVAVIDPSGRRLSWASASGKVRARDCTSRSREALAISSGSAGAFVVEIVRADVPEVSAAPVRGKVRITSLGRTQIVPFVLVGEREQVARVDVRFDSRLEPVNAWPAW
jgi:hypothetical protein